MNNYIYYTKEGKFETDEHSKIPIHLLHSPNDETPAMEDNYNDKRWFFEGKVHRLNGPALIFGTGGKQYYLNGKHYSKFEEWLQNHPNQDVTFQALMKLKNL